MSECVTLVGIDGAFEETTQFENAPNPFAFLALNAHAVPTGWALKSPVGAATFVAPPIPGQVPTPGLKVMS